MDRKIFNLSSTLSIEPLLNALYALGSTTKNLLALYLDNGVTDGGAVFFNAGTTSFLKSIATGLTLDIGGFTLVEPNADATTALGSAGKSFKWLQLDNGGTDGGAVFFNTVTTSFLKSSTDGLTLDVGGFTTFEPAVTNTTDLGTNLLRFKDIYGIGKLELGSAAGRISIASGPYMAEKIYVEHTALGASEYLNGLGVYAYTKTGGNATAYARAIRGALSLESGALLSEAYGAYFSVSQADGSKIADHAYGSLSQVSLAETDLADLPTGMVVGALGLYSVSGTDPAIGFAAGTYFMAALAGVVGSESKAPHAVVMAILQGDSAGDLKVPAAFKAVAERSTAGKGFDYGLDLKQEGAGLCDNINVADIRGLKGNILKNLATDVWEANGILKSTVGIQTVCASVNLSGAVPTAAQCGAAFASGAVAGFLGVISDSSDATKSYAIFYDGANFFQAAFTKTV